MNQLIIIEHGQLRTVDIDDRTQWRIGRGSSQISPDILLYTPTVSRSHGVFENMDGLWFYFDDPHIKNRTFYNNKLLGTGMGGKPKPVMLRSGDVLILGCGKDPAINDKTVWILFLSTTITEPWRAVDTGKMQSLTFSDGEGVLRLDNPAKGTLVRQQGGIGIYMGPVTYLLGQMMLGTGES